MKTPIAVFWALLLVGGALSADSSAAWVQLREAPVYETASGFSKVVGKLTLGTQVAVNDTKTDWSRVASGKLTGWVRTKNLTAKKVTLQATDAVGGTNSSEVALAGKGFSEAIETGYRADSALDYSVLDRMEDWGVDPADRKDFLRGLR
jgi:uncharacterized protein YgiM (DUF1202 family)